MKKRIISAVIGASLALAGVAPMTPAVLSFADGPVVINEIESNDAAGGKDWVEIINTGSTEADISGYVIVDDKGYSGRSGDVTPLPEGTKLAPGAVLVLTEDTDFRFGLGKNDTVTLCDKSGNPLDTDSWTGHAKGTWSRVPDGTGSFVDQAPTKGERNVKTAENTVFLNEVDTAPEDWVELVNTGSSAVDVSGYEIRDNADDHRFRIADGTSIAPGAYFVIRKDTAGLIFNDSTGVWESGAFGDAFGLAAGNSVRLYDKAGTKIDSCSWQAEAAIGGSTAAAAYGRIPDSTGSFTVVPATPGAKNVKTSPVVINEVQSKDPSGGPDWIELANTSAEDVDISGLILKDSEDGSKHTYTIPDGTTIPANGFIVFRKKGGSVTEGFPFGIGADDTIRLFNGDILIDSTAWTGDTSPTWGRYPDVNGKEFKSTEEPTPGAANKFRNATGIKWPGSQDVTVWDKEPTFLEDSSGLDFHGTQLYAVDNGTAKFWVLDVAKDWTMKIAPGFENGKTVHFKDENSSAGPDAEGITVDGDGMVYLASERDNDHKKVNFDTVLMVDPNAAGPDLQALKEWDLTDLLNEAVAKTSPDHPAIDANMGIESVEWIPDAAAKQLTDANTGKAYDPAAYPGARAGVFLTAVEQNGHVYAFVLKNDETAVLIADLDPGLGGAMALDYDTYENVLWVHGDNGFENMSVKMKLNGEKISGSESNTRNILAPENMVKTANNEGFAIAPKEYARNGERPVWFFQDGVASGALTMGTLYINYTPNDPIKPVNPANPSKPSGKTAAANGAGPATGDTENAAAWALLLAGALGTLGAAEIRRRRKEAC